MVPEIPKHEVEPRYPNAQAGGAHAVRQSSALSPAARGLHPALFDTLCNFRTGNVTTQVDSPRDHAGEWHGVHRRWLGIHPDDRAWHRLPCHPHPQHQGWLGDDTRSIPGHRTQAQPHLVPDRCRVLCRRKPVPDWVRSVVWCPRFGAHCVASRMRRYDADPARGSHALAPIPFGAWNSLSTTDRQPCNPGPPGALCRSEAP